MKQQTIRAASWSKEQIQEAARGGENEESQQENVPNPVNMIPPVRPAIRSSTSAKHNAPKTREAVQAQEQAAATAAPTSNRAFPPKERPAPVSQTASPQPPTAGTAGDSPAVAAPSEVFVTGMDTPVQGSSEYAVRQGRQAARKKMVQKQAARKQLAQQQKEWHTETVTLEQSMPEGRQVVPRVSGENTPISHTKVRSEHTSKAPKIQEKPQRTNSSPQAERKDPEPVPQTEPQFKEKYQTVKAKEKAFQGHTSPATPHADGRQANTSSARPVQPVKQRTASVKEVDKAVRTAETSQRTTQAARSTQAAQAAAKAGKQAAESGKKAAKELSQKALQAIIAAGKSMVAALGAGGAIALLVVVVVMLVGILLVSPFGIFFSGGADNEMTLQQAMGILNTEFNDRITEIENSVAHDDLRQDGQQASWKEVLAIYAVKVTTDKENPMEVVTMDEEHLELLGQIFWDMNQIYYTTEPYTEEVTVEVPAENSTDEDGVTEEVQTVERTRLVITITSKAALQMAEDYGFDQEQLDLLNELLSEEYANLWFGVPGGSDDIVEVALSQVGNVGGQPYWSWYGFGSRVEWCACFVSWCADQCGYIEAETFTKFSYCDAGIAWFKSRGQWQTRGYCPSPGDIIFFDWNNNGVSDHVGIVESCDGYYVYTVEGNANNAVQQLRYSINYSGIEGYGTPNYG